MKTVPRDYVELRQALPTAEVSIGYSGLVIEPIADIPAAQQGYSIIPEGDSTDWKDAWIVVGRETSMGDPVFIDAEGEGLPVYTAPHGEGSWNPSLIAPTSGIFFDIVRRLAALAKGRESPAALERNPLSQEEVEVFLSFLSEFFEDEVPPFWTLMVKSESE